MSVTPMAVNRPMSIDAVNRALTGDRLLFLSLQASDSESPGPKDLKQTGTVGVIRQMARGAHGLQIVVEGLERVYAESISLTEQTMTANIRRAPEEVVKSVEVDAYMRRLGALRVTPARAADREAVAELAGLARSLKRVETGRD